MYVFRRVTETKKYCKLQPDFNLEVDKKEKKKFNPIDPNGMTCDGVSSKMKETEERNPQYYYAQRFVDASNCEDLIIKDDAKNRVLSKLRAATGSAFRGSSKSGPLSGLSKKEQKDYRGE